MMAVFLAAPRPTWLHAITACPAHRAFTHCVPSRKPNPTPGLIVRRAMATLDVSRDPRIRMLRQPPNKQIDYYYTQLLGKDWRKQFKQVRVRTHACCPRSAAASRLPRACP